MHALGPRPEGDATTVDLPHEGGRQLRAALDERAVRGGTLGLDARSVDMGGGVSGHPLIAGIVETNHAGRRVCDLNASVVDEDDGAVCARESHYEQRAAQRKGSAEQRAGDEQ